MLLSKDQLAILKVLYTKPLLTFSEVSEQLPQLDERYIRMLMSELASDGLAVARIPRGVVTDHPTSKDRFELTEIGKAEFETYSSNESRLQKNFRLSVSALIVSAISAAAEAIHWFLT